MKDLEFQNVEPLQIMHRVRKNFTHHFLPKKLPKFYLESMTAMKNLPLKCVYLRCKNPHQTFNYLLPPHPHCPLSSSVL